MYTNNYTYIPGYVQFELYTIARTHTMYKVTKSCCIKNLGLGDDQDMKYKRRLKTNFNNN